ncbi:periplasmic beta-glucosidase precursor [Aspergillus pseudoustus]|uniref:beta-glucosidase n=1 Tax=Aspergillus pseudoustus TaxID=1810923 RepID=A0ABR4JQ51_9EURO
MAVDIDILLSQLTLEEKISMTAGASTWRSAEISRLGIPNIKVSDGPSGARGEVFGEGVPAAFLPSGVSLGATWDIELLREMGELLAEETKSKSASVLLSPTMCLARNPLGGRNFETYGEDPYHVGKLATALVQGLQSRRVGATPKHFVANDSEVDRFGGNRVVPTRALREVYLLPFQMVVRDADPWCIMSAYNKVNSSHCDTSSELLSDILRREWGWKGLVMSDWGATYTTGPSLRAGMDLEMPGPPLKRTQEAIKDAIKNGEVSIEQVEDSARRLLYLLQRAGRFEDASDVSEVCLNKPEHAQKLRHAARSGIVLLKNESQALPLRPVTAPRRLAIVGPNAKRIVAGGGGSAYIKAPYWTSAFESLKAEFQPRGTEIVYHVGSRVNRYLPTAYSELCRDPDNGAGGGAVDWFDGHDTTQNPVASRHIDDLYYISYGDLPPEIDRVTNYSFRVRTILTAQTTGTHKLSLAGIGPSKLFVDGKEVVSESGKRQLHGELFYTYGSHEVIITMNMVAGQEYNVVVEGHSHDRQLDPELKDSLKPMEDQFQGVRIGYEEEIQADLPSEAARLCSDTDAAIIVVGRDKEWETEGLDMPMWELPGDQARLIEEVAAVCPRTIVVVQAGTPVKAEPWVHKVQAVLYCWYQGQELGNAVSDVICGHFNPSGRLPVTYPRRIEHAPGTSQPWEPGTDSTVLYGEGIHVGHRWFDFIGVDPLFPLGYGLSYSELKLSDISITNGVLGPHSPVTLSVRVTNLGGDDLPTRQTILAFAAPATQTRLSRPVKQLSAFVKTPELNAGESCNVNLEIGAYSLGVFDALINRWVIDAGSEFDILVGTNAGDAAVVGQVKVIEEITWVHTIKSDQ